MAADAHVKLAGKALDSSREGMLCLHGDDREGHLLELADLVGSEDHNLDHPLALVGVQGQALQFSAGVNLVLRVYISPDRLTSSQNTLLNILIWFMLVKTFTTEIQACKLLSQSPPLKTILSLYGECFSFCEQKVASA